MLGRRSARCRSNGYYRDNAVYDRDVLADII